MSGPNGGQQGGTGDGGAGGGGTGDGGAPPADQKTFTQAELEAQITERLNRERDATRRKYADYDTLKAQAAGAQTAEQQIAALQQQVAETQRAALRSSIQAEYGISNEDAELFLVGNDKETLERQAKRLKQHAEDLAKNGGTASREGGNGRPKISEEKQVARTLFGGRS